MYCFSAFHLYPCPTLTHIMTRHNIKSPLNLWHSLANCLLYLKGVDWFGQTSQGNATTTTIYYAYCSSCQLYKQFGPKTFNILLFFFQLQISKWLCQLLFSLTLFQACSVGSFVIIKIISLFLQFFKCGCNLFKKMNRFWRCRQMF